jgi:C-terminal processing protease CtpA/Prc
LLQEVHDVVSQNYVDARGRGFDRAHWDAALDAALHPPPRDLGSARLAVRALLAFGLKGDPYTRYAPPAEFAGMARYDLTGVGLNLGSGDEFGRKTGEAPSPAAAGAAPALAGTPPPGGVWVVGLVPGSPAAAAGVAQGDRVLGVSGSGVGAGEAPGAVAARVRAAAAAAGATAAPAAAPAAPVASAPATFPLEVAHPDGARETLLITPPFALPGAASADASPVSARTERDGELGVVRLDAFTARARADTVAALGELLGAGSRVSELALDLRGNRGGLVSEGVAVASLFLPPGAVVTITEGATPSAERVLTAPATTPTFPAPALRPPPPGTRTLPLAVWVDGRTASAAEIVAGALRGNCRAPLLGPGRPGAGRGGRTYGKGLIQSVYGLGDGSGLVLTVGKYLTPGRGDIDGAGLAADGGGAGGSGGEVGPRVLGACTVPPRN